MKKFKPDVIVSMFGCADLSRSNSSVWDESYKADFVKGYNEIIESLKAWGVKMILVTPFLRTLEDVRRDVLLKEGGMTDTVVELAKTHDLPVVDFFTATKEQEGLIVIRKKIDTISEAGTELLANMVAEEIKK